MFCVQSFYGGVGMNFLKGTIFVLCLSFTTAADAGFGNIIAGLGDGSLKLAVSGLMGARALQSGAQSLQSAHQSVQGIGHTVTTTAGDSNTGGLMDSFFNRLDQSGQSFANNAMSNMDFGMTDFVKNEISTTNQALQNNMNVVGNTAANVGSEVSNTSVHAQNVMSSGLDSWNQTNLAMQQGVTSAGQNLQTNMNSFNAHAQNQMSSVANTANANMNQASTNVQNNMNSFNANAQGRMTALANTANANMNQVGNVATNNMNQVGTTAHTNITNIGNAAQTNMSQVGSAAQSNMNSFSTNAQGRVTAITNAAAANMNNVGTTATTHINSVGSATTNNINAMGTTATTNINAVGSAAQTNMNQVGSAATTNINATGEQAQGRITALGQTANEQIQATGSAATAAVNSNSNAFQAQVAATGNLAQYQVAATGTQMSAQVHQHLMQMNNQMQVYTTLTHAQVQAILQTTTPSAFASAVVIAPNSQEVIWWLNKLDAGVLGAATTIQAMTPFLDGQRIALANQLKTLRDVQVQQMIADDYEKLSSELRTGARQFASTAHFTQQVTAQSAQILLHEIDQPYFQPYLDAVERQQVYQLKRVFAQNLQVVVRSTVPTMTAAAFSQFKNEYASLQGGLAQSAQNAVLQASHSLTALQSQAQQAVAQTQQQAQDALTDTEAALQAEIAATSSSIQESADTVADAALAESEEGENYEKPDIEEIERDNLDVATEEVTDEDGNAVLNEDGTTKTIIGRR